MNIFFSQPLQWSIALLPALVGLALLPSSWIITIVLLIASATIILAGLTEIPAEPPHVGLGTIWGERKEVLIPEGLKLFLNFFPFLVNVIKVNVDIRNKDFNFDGVRCRLETKDAERPTVAQPSTTAGRQGLSQDQLLSRVQDKFRNPSAYGEPESGGEVKVHVGMTYVPDYSTNSQRETSAKRIIRFLNYNADSGVQKALDQVLEEDVRQVGRILTWTEYTFATDFLSAYLVHKLTGVELPRLDPTGNRVEGSTVKPYDASAAEITYYLEQILTNGLSDIRDMGIKITRLNVADVIPTGKLAEDAELSAREVQQATQRLREIASRKAEIAAMKEGGDGSLTDKEIWENIRIEDGKASEYVVRGSGNPFADAAAFFTGKEKKR